MQKHRDSRLEESLWYTNWVYIAAAVLSVFDDNSRNVEARKNEKGAALDDGRQGAIRTPATPQNATGRNAAVG
jgi:hypothetical protein